MCHCVITQYIKQFFDSLDSGDLPYKIVNYMELQWVRLGRLDSRVVSVLDSSAEGPGSNRSRDAVG